jgi:hypothetical protein
MIKVKYCFGVLPSEQFHPNTSFRGFILSQSLGKIWLQTRNDEGNRISHGNIQTESVSGTYSINTIKGTVVFDYDSAYDVDDYWDYTVTNPVSQLFPDLTETESSVGSVLYRCIALKFVGPGTDMPSYTFVDPKSNNGDIQYAIGFDPVGIVTSGSTTTAQPVNDTTAPEGVTFSDTLDMNYLTTVSPIGGTVVQEPIMSSGENVFIYIRRTVPANYKKSIRNELLNIITTFRD